MRKKLAVWFGVLLLLVCSVIGCGKSLEEQIVEQLELGQKYLAELNYEEAIVAFTKAIELEEKTEAAYIGLAEAYEGTGDVWQATQTLETGYELFPKEDMKNSLAEAYKRALEFFAEDAERQIEIYNRLIQLSPDAEYYQKLAEIYEMQGNVEQAEKILEDGITTMNSEELKEKLEKLNGPEIITVDGIIRYIDEIPEYKKERDRYFDQYAGKEDNVGFSSVGEVLRLLEPATVMIEGKMVSISETSVAFSKRAVGEKIPETIDETRGQVVRLTGHFKTKEWEGEFTGPICYDKSERDLSYHYDPTGPYYFVIEELTQIS